MKKAIEILRRMADSTNENLVDQFDVIHSGNEEKYCPIVDCETQATYSQGPLADEDELHTILNIFHENKRRIAKIVVYFEDSHTRKLEKTKGWDPL
jgi:hypothetical protein